MDEIHDIGSRSPSLTASLPARRAFLLIVSDDVDPADDRISGRVEHLESGRRVRFSTREELSAFFADVLSEGSRIDDPESKS